METILDRFSKLVTILLFLGLTATLSAGCPCKSTEPRSEKTYVQPGQVQLQKDRIYIQTAQGMICTTALFSDTEGLYIKTREASEECPDGFWQCRTCGYCNENYYLWCRLCGHS